MKTSKELKKIVFSRIMCCFGELCTMFFISVGGFSIFILACMIAAKLLERSGASAFPYGLLFLISVVAFILLVIAAIPFSYGISWYRLQQVRGNSVHARSVFSCYTSIKKLWQVLRLNSMLIIKQLHVIVLAAGISALGFFISDAVYDRTNGGTMYYAVFVLAVVITVCMLCLLAAFNVRYAAVPYLYALASDRPAAEIIDESKMIMQGKTRYLTEIMRSVAGWLIPCLIIFPMIFIVPYIQMIYTAAINEIILSDSGGEEQTGETVSAGTAIPVQE